MSNLHVQNVVCCFMIATVQVLHGDLLPSGFFVAGQNTSFSFPAVYNDAEINHFIELGDSSIYNSAIYLNSWDYIDGGINYSCGKCLYPDMVRMYQDPSSNQLSSFSTSFTFDFILIEGIDKDGIFMNADGFAFTFSTDNSTFSRYGQGTEILCVNKTIPTTRLFAVEVDTYLNPDDFDPSDSHIGVDLKSVIHVNTLTPNAIVHNLCQSPGNTTHCGYFANNAGPFTVWVDYDGPTQTLDVRFSRGPSASKPEVAIIHTKLDLSPVLNDFMYVGFSGSFEMYREVHRILSWNFSSSPSPQTLSPAPSSQAMPPANLAASRTNVALIAGIIAGVLGVCATIILVIFKLCCCKRRRNQGTIESTLKLHLMGPRIFSYRELSKATKDFSKSELLGSGGFGTVYKGTFLGPPGTVVAVKRCTRPNKPHAEEGFVAEATSISQIRHRNLVQLQGWCQERGQLLLVYDYMPNGSLDDWIFKNSEVVLTWDLRYNILTGVAAALAYLHEEWQQCVLHRDIKTSNVMLDSEFNAHLGDFGLARLIDHEKAEKTTMMAGTLGYMAPEMYYTGKASKETDIYSFGVLILEVVCGRRPLNTRALNPEDMVLVDCVWRAHEAGELLSMADPRLGTGNLIASLSGCVSNNVPREDSGRISSRPNSVKDVLQLGLLCCQLNPSKRPSMSLVIQMFQTGDGAALPALPTTKAPLPYGFANSEISSSITSSSSFGSQQM